MMRLTSKNIDRVMNPGKILNKMAYQPTPFDMYPNQLELVNQFIERQMYEVMYSFINMTNGISEEFLFDKNSVRYKRYYVSFLLFLSTTLSEENFDEDYYRSATKVKELFYKTIIVKCLTRISPILKTIFYRYYNGISVPKLKILRTPKNKTFLKGFIDIIRKKILKEDKLEESFDKFIEIVYSEADETLSDYILNWIKMKLDFLAADLTMWRDYTVRNNSEFFSLADIDLNYWGEFNAISIFDKNNNYNENKLIENLVSLAENQLFINKLKTVFDPTNYSLTKEI